MAERFPIPTYYFILMFFITRLVNSITGKPKPSITSLPQNLLSLDVATRLSNDHDSLKLASSDYGNIIKEIPAAVLYPSSLNDIQTLLKFSYSNPMSFNVAVRGQGHSVRGQAMARGGIVVDMTSMNNMKNHRKRKNNVFFGRSMLGGYYADVGGKELWIDVLNETLKYGYSCVTWTDYLYLSVGGTLSNAGIGGQTFRFGPQISNVLELDVVTGKGDFVACSAQNNSELFYAVLGGFGQFGIITRARIALEPAPKRVKWIRLLYDDFTEFTKDQESIISINGRKQENAVNYLEGSLVINHGPPENWRSSFFPPSDKSRIMSIVNQHNIIYCLEVAKYYEDHTRSTIEKELQLLLEGLNFIPGFMYEKDVSYLDFLNRVRSGELKLKSEGLWDVQHPWLNLFVPKSRILDFDAAVFKDIILRRNITTGPVLVYPMNRSKWDDRMSVVTPDEEVFYTIGFLHSSGYEDWKAFDDQNKEILQFCANAGIQFKQYLPNYKSQEDWINHFGLKWTKFQQLKTQFDPRMILSPGQRIFNV